MNEIAFGVGVSAIPIKSPWWKVQKLITTLQGRLIDDETTEALQISAKMWSDNGGHLQGELVTAPAEPTSGNDDDVDDGSPVPKHRVLLPFFKIESHAFMGTYNSQAFTESTWSAFETFTKNFSKKFGATAWGACLEESLHPTSSQSTRKYHAHNYFFWDGGDGLRLSGTDDLVFQRVRPRIDVCTVTSPPLFKAAAMHGLWYVSGVCKLGGVVKASNYVPWRNYYPRSDWLESLWGQHKLSHEQYEKISAKLGVGHAERMHNLAAVRRTERAVAIREHLKKEAALLSASSQSQFKVYQEAEEFISFFLPTAGMHRRPILVIIGGTNLGKSMLAAHILKRVGDALGLDGYLEVTVEADSNLDLAAFDVETQAGILLDGVGDAVMLHTHRESLQGRLKEGVGGKSSTMMYAYPFTLCHRAVVATMDLSAANLQYFTDHHWLSDRRNVIALRLESQAWI